MAATKYQNMSYSDIRSISQFSNVVPGSTNVLWGINDNQYSGSNLNPSGSSWKWLCNAIDIYWGKPSLNVTGDVTSITNPTIATTTDLLNFVQTTAQAVNKAHSLISSLTERVTVLENADPTVLVSSISLDGEEWAGEGIKQLNEGDTYQIRVTVLPPNASNPSIAWTSSDETIATVSNTGLVTALKGGSVTITGTTTDGSNKSVTCKFDIAEMFLCKLILNDGSTVELEGSGTLTSSMIDPYKSTLVSAEIGKLCTGIGSHAFFNCPNLTNITISDSVTSIGDSAFWRCTGLTSITIPNSVTTIQGAFNSCSNLESISIGSGVTSIGDGAFSFCTSLSNINVDTDNAVYDSRNNCNAIIETETNILVHGCKTTIIPDSIISIGSYAFYGCTGLTSITIPDSVTGIGERAFSECTGLTSITSLATTAPTIQNSTFRSIKTGGTLTVPNGSTGYDAWMSEDDYYLGLYNWTIEYESYNGFCKLTLNDGSTVELEGDGELTSSMIEPYKSELVSAEIGNLCTSIGGIAFRECTGLTSIIIPNNVTSISGNTFDGCTGLTSITIPDSVTSIDSRVFLNCTSLSNVTIGNSVTSIGEHAFQGCTGLTSITIPDSVTSIGEGAFQECSGLTYITIPDSVTSIGTSAFLDCIGLISITIGNSVTSIGLNALTGCTGLTSITSFATVAPTIQYSTFRNIKTGGTLTVPSGSTGYDVWMSEDNYYLGQQNWTKVESSNSDEVWEYHRLQYKNNKGMILNKEIPVSDDGILSSDDIATYKPNLISIEIGRCGSISDSTFAGCTELVNVTIPKTVTDIGDSAFANCIGLNSITSLATTAPTIQNNTFNGVKTGGTLTVQSGSTGYDVWMSEDDYYLGQQNWTIEYIGQNPEPGGPGPDN